MAKIEPFERFIKEYENWFERNNNLYLSEVVLLRNLLKDKQFNLSLEVGVGSGRFAQPLKVKYGLDPSTAMLKIALRRGIKVVRGIISKNTKNLKK